MSAEIELRNYQGESIEALRAGIRAKHRAQILMAPTGAGKTICAAYLLHEAHAKGSKAWMVMDRISLCDQTSAVLDRYGIDHGVMQAGHWRNRVYEPIQVCSAQTLEKRGYSDIDLLIVDECHTMRKSTIDFIGRGLCKVIGLSATPFSAGLAKTYTNLVNVTTTDKLIGEGHLVPLKMYAAKAIDMSGAKVVAGEWSEGEIEKRGKEIIGDIVAEWQSKTTLHFGGAVKTLVFSATVDHGKELCSQFNAAGFNFQQISYKDGSDDSRRELIEEFRKSGSAINGLVSCEVLTKGFDVPDVQCLVAARPYRKSFSSHIQQLGRGMRPSPGKDFCLVLDHAGNLLRFYADMIELFANGMQKLDAGEHDSRVHKDPEDKVVEQIKCSCGFLMHPAMEICPACGKKRNRRSLVETLPGVMLEVGGKPLPEWLTRPDDVWKQICSLATQRKGDDVAAAKRFALAQYRNLYQAWPKHDFAPSNVPVDIRLKSNIQSLMIRWAKSKRNPSSQAAR